jgi:hypothetical protein
LRRSLIRGDRYRFRVHLEGPALTFTSHTFESVSTRGDAIAARASRP